MHAFGTIALQNFILLDKLYFRTMIHWITACSTTSALKKKKKAHTIYTEKFE